jgi:hypothetical protein
MAEKSGESKGGILGMGICENGAVLRENGVKSHAKSDGSRGAP